MAPPPPISPTPPPQNAPKKPGLLTYLLLGCGGMILLAVLALGIGGYLLYLKGREIKAEYDKNPTLFAAETAVKLHPDYDFVSKDLQTQTITLRDKNTGAVYTFNFAEIQSGKWLDKIAAELETAAKKQLPATPEADLQNDPGSGVSKGTEPIPLTHEAALKRFPAHVPPYPGARFRMAQYLAEASTNTGLYAFSSRDDLDKICSFYQEKWKAEGYTLKEEPQEGGRILSGEKNGGEGTVSFTASTDPESREVSVILHFTESR
ncbi:MAG: hypothetical protein SFY92_09450 [Verrucomicrobiae bacterium]|nr:hypothetical protein [Verrucomicrobiae bacterium]